MFIIRKRKDNGYLFLVTVSILKKKTPKSVFSIPFHANRSLFMLQSGPLSYLVMCVMVERLNKTNFLPVLSMLIFFKSHSDNDHMSTRGVQGSQNCMLPLPLV